MKTGNQKVKRLTINLPTPDYEELQATAISEVVPITQIVRRALLEEKFLREEQKKKVRY